MNDATLQSVEQHNATTYTFWFKPLAPIDYTAGQFIEIFLPHEADDRGTHRWFTLSSSPSEPLIAITTRKAAKQSSFKKILFGLSPGDTVQVSQAMGDFVLPIQKSVPIIFLVRGIGITPVRSILKSMQDNNEDRQITLIYSVKQDHDALFTDITSAVTDTVDTLELPTIYDVDLPVKKTLEHMKKAPTSRIFVSGPEQFVEKAYEQLLSEGIKESSITRDYFHGYRS